MTRWDKALVVLVASLALVSVPATLLARPSSANVAVITSPSGESEIPLDRDGCYEVRGRVGTLKVAVAAGDVRVVEAGCPDQVCVRTGGARAAGAVVCAPNGVTVRCGEGEDGLDARSR